MRWSQTLIPTLKETPSEAETSSHKLMIRAGLIRKLASGVYSYLPLGLRVLKKVEEIIRQEMDAQDAQEVLLPILQPMELWERSGRDKDLGEDMVSFVDRHGKKVVLGPTHEEVITELVRSEVNSYRQLPLILYQIQAKFRDEIRPRFGVIRSREFLMKDSYSFDKDKDGLDESYRKMHDAYCRIFDRCGLSYIVVEADPGVMGGDISHEFMIPADNGEDVIVHCKSCGYAASFSRAECIKESLQFILRQAQDTSAKDTERSRSAVYSLQQEEPKPLREVDTPDIKTVQKVSELLDKPLQKIVKTLIYQADNKIIAVLIRGDHNLNEAKLSRLVGCQQLKMADQSTIERVTGAPLGFAGPVGLKDIDLIADYQVTYLTDFVTGANRKDKHLINVNLKRDFKVDLSGDIRFITEEDPCPRCRKAIEIRHAIEVGHIFKLGTKYSQSLGATYLDEEGQNRPIIMGCYGIGVNRIVASCIEQNHDKDGIIWPVGVSPYQILILPVNSRDKESMDLATELYEKFLKNGIDVLLDDRDQRAGSKFKDADLIGIPIKVVIGQRNLSQGDLELEVRRTGQVLVVKRQDAIVEAKKLLDRLKKM